MAKRPKIEPHPFKTQVTFRSAELVHAIDDLVLAGQREGCWPMSYSRSDWINDAILGKHKLPAAILVKLKG